MRNVSSDSNSESMIENIAETRVKQSTGLQKTMILKVIKVFKLVVSSGPRLRPRKKIEGPLEHSFSKSS